MGFRYRETVLLDGTRICVLPVGIMESHPHGGAEWHVAEGDCAKLPAKSKKMATLMGEKDETTKSAGDDRPRSANQADRELP